MNKLYLLPFSLLLLNPTFAEDIDNSQVSSEIKIISVEDIRNRKSLLQKLQLLKLAALLKSTLNI